jgi:hypothetical protein
VSTKDQNKPYVILTFGNNNSYPSLVTNLKGVDVDYENKQWSFQGRTYPFAKKRYIQHGCLYGPISVYDRESISQLKSMLFAWGDYVGSRDGSLIE